MKVEFDRYPPQKFLSDLRRFLQENKPPNSQIQFTCELADPAGYEEEMQQGTACKYYIRKRNCSDDLSFSVFYVQEHPFGYWETAQYPRLQGPSHCPHCLCAPCIIAMPPDYLRGSASPHDANDEKRHVLYRKFWQTLKGLGLWQDQEYLRRKEQWTTRDDKRDIIPDCVTQVGWDISSTYNYIILIVHTSSL